MDLVGQRLRNTRIVSLLGEGGMGKVYLGFDEALQRKVALKALRPSARLDPENKARFLREARVLSQLEHPNICKIHDFVEHEGHEILVLEYVEGRTLAEAMNEGLSEPERFRVALQLTRVLLAAHSASVIHRDLKPDNVLLTPEGQIKVLDFGLARPLTPDESTEGAQASGTFFAVSPESGADVTRSGGIVGTIAYMSPEQARGEPLTTASDMYSLGLLLHQLFADEPAYDPRLPAAVKKQKVAKAETRPVEGIDPSLGELIHRLEALIPDSRPRAADVLERLEWIRSRPRRGRRRLAAAAAVLALAGAGAKYTYDLRQEQQRTLTALAEAEQARREAQQVSEFLVDVFRVSEPTRARGEEVTAREILDRGAERVERELADQPRVQARLLGTIGTVYHLLGLYDEAARLFEQTVEIRRAVHPGDHEDLATALHELAEVHHFLDRYDDAMALYVESLAMRRRLLPADHPAIAASLAEMGRIHYDQGRFDEAQALLEESLAIRRRVLDPKDRALASNQHNLANVLSDRGQDRRAEELYGEAIAILEESLGEDHPEVASVLESVGAMYLGDGRAAAAEPFFRRAFAIRKKILGGDHPNLAIAASYLAFVSTQEGRYGEAEALLLQALAIFEKTVGPEHFNVGVNLLYLGRVRLETGRLAEAEASYRRSLRIFETTGAADNYNAILVRDGLGDVALARQDGPASEEHYRRALTQWRSVLGADSPEAVDTMIGLARSLARQGRRDEARELFEEALERSRPWAEKDPENLAAIEVRALVEVKAGTFRAAQGEDGEARDLWRRALATVARLTDADTRAVLLALRAEAHLRLGERAAAAPLVERLRSMGWSDPELVGQSPKPRRSMTPDGSPV